MNFLGEIWKQLAKIQKYIEKVHSIKKLNQDSNQNEIQSSKKRKLVRRDHRYYQLINNSSKIVQLIDQLKMKVESFAEVARYLKNTDHKTRTMEEILIHYFSSSIFKVKKYLFIRFSKILGMKYILSKKDIRNDELTKGKRIDCACKMIDLYNDKRHQKFNKF